MHICLSIRRVIAASLAAWVLATPAQAGGKAGENAVVSFHIETEHAENPKMVFSIEAGGKTRHFRRTPEISSKDFAAFRPFPSDDVANTYGIVFQLKNTAARRLTNIGNANQGRMLLAMANGRAVDMVMIDVPVDDGFIVIWKGITDAEIRMYEGKLPRIGEDKKKR